MSPWRLLARSSLLALLAAGPGLAQTPAPPAADAGLCRTDLQSFDQQLDHDGYWLGAMGYGYGYPMDGYGYGYPSGGPPAITGTGYHYARPGNQVRILLAAAEILAGRGQQGPCEAVVANAREVYKLYLAQLRGNAAPVVDGGAWRKQQIAAAVPVTSGGVTLRSDQLLGSEVRNLQDQSLGRVDDLVLNPADGTIAYLVLARGGLLGVDQHYVPVPWPDFRMTPTQTLLVLDSSGSVLDAAPRVEHAELTDPGQTDLPKIRVNGFWQAHFATGGKPAGGE